MKTTISHHGHAVTAAQLNSLDFFAGGVPAGAVFQLSAGEMKRLLAAKPQGAIGRTLEQVCFIGLVSYFEAFWESLKKNWTNSAGIFSGQPSNWPKIGEPTGFSGDSRRC